MVPELIKGRCDRPTNKSQIYRHIPLKFSSADVNDLDLDVFLGDENELNPFIVLAYTF